MNGKNGKKVIGSALFAGFMVVSVGVMTTYLFNHARAYPYDNNIGEYGFGTISSLQNDENGVPAWILFGHWKGNLPSNQSSVEGQGNESSLSGESFNAQFEMVRLNGSAAHTHTITNFVISNSSQVKNSTIFNGTATASLREGPVTDIPASITITGNKVISIWLEPSKVNSHYGNTPIYGLVMNDAHEPTPTLKSDGPQLGRQEMGQVK